MSRRSQLFIVLVALTLLGPAVGQKVEAGFDPGGQFILKCPWTGNTGNIDPIIAPGVTSAHQHDFFGNKFVTPNSTYDQLTSVPNNSTGSTCYDTKDTAAYWAPTLYFNGEIWRVKDNSGARAVNGYAMRAYYLDRPNPPHGPLYPIPAGAQMIQGFPSATEPAPDTKYVYYSCGADKGVVTPKARWPYDCRPYDSPDPAGFHPDGVVARADMPWCWDGKTAENGGLEPGEFPQYIPEWVHAGGRVNFTYWIDGQPCPPDFPFMIPRVSLRLHTVVMDPCMGATPCTADDPATANNVKIQFAGPAGSNPAPFWTFHIDFWNTWNQNGGNASLPVRGTLESLIHDCLDPNGPNGQKQCGVVKDWSPYPAP